MKKSIFLLFLPFIDIGPSALSSAENAVESKESAIIVDVHYLM
jgi:hypothetical protein